MKDSLWSVDLFRCESASLRTYRVLVAIDQYSRRIIGIPGHERPVDGIAPGKMFNLAILIVSVRRDCLGKALFWNERDPERKLLDFKRYSNRYPTHDALGVVAPAMRAELAENKVIDLYNSRSKSHYPGLYRTPILA